MFAASTSVTPQGGRSRHPYPSHAPIHGDARTATAPDDGTSQGESIRMPARRLQATRGPGMYNAGYRGFSYRGGMW